MSSRDSSDTLTLEEQRYAISTWRYLRLSTVALLLGLGMAVGFERWKVHPGCFQTSVSAYYYTPAQGIVVGALIAVGVCLICVKSNNDIENGLLNLAGIFAPAVALVPTPNTGSCASVLGTTHDRNVNIANNGFALLAVGGIAIVLSIIVLAAGRQSKEPRPSPITWIGYFIALAVWVAAVIVFAGFRSVFVGNAHYAAATAMGVCIVTVVIINALDLKKDTQPPSQGVALFQPSRWNRYGLIAAAMVIAVVISIILEITGWDFWLLFIELAIAGLFAAFWAVQTAELWHSGLR